MRLSLRSLLMVLLPAALLIGLLNNTLWGNDGIAARYQLVEQLAERRAEHAHLESGNRRLLLELHALESDPLVVERLVADELGWAREGDLLVAFPGE